MGELTEVQYQVTKGITLSFNQVTCFKGTYKIN